MSENEKTLTDNSDSAALEAEVPSDLPKNESGNSQVAGHTSFEKIVEAVLNSAGVANQSAVLAATSTENLLNAVGDIGSITARARVTSMIVLFTSALLLAAAAGAFVTVSFQLNSRLTQANNTLAVVAKGASKLNEDLEKWKRLDKLIEEIGGNKTSESIEKLGNRMEAISDLMKQVAAPLQPEKSLKQEEVRNKALTNQIKSLDAQNQYQARVIIKLTEQVQASRAEISKILGAVRSVDSQVANLYEKQRSTPPAQQPPVSIIPPQVREREKQPDPKNVDYIQYRAADTSSPPKPR